jgi:hypothetical protein
MSDVEAILQLIPGVGMWVVFLWLFLRADNAQKQERELRFDRLEGKIDQLAQNLLDHINST